MSMKWLLWKDYRHNRLIVLVGLAILLAPYLIGLGVMCGGRWLKTGTHDGQAVYWKPNSREIVAGACLYSLVLSQLTLAFVGGNAIAGERVDRSGEFLYSLPIARRRLLASKLLFALAIAAVIWLVSGAVFASMIHTIPKPHRPIPPEQIWDFFRAAMTVAITGFTFFCVAWFLSSFVSSPAVDVCGGLITPFLVISGLAILDWALKISGLSQTGVTFDETHHDGTIAVWFYCTICLAISLVCFAVGTWHYLRRVEP